MFVRIMEGLSGLQTEHRTVIFDLKRQRVFAGHQIQ